jgi:hypothetical protein
MNNTQKRKWLGKGSMAIMAAAILLGTSGFGKIIRDKTAGDNLGFETVKKGMPVNWYFYTQESINNNILFKPKVSADFDVAVVSNGAKEGKNHLKYTIRNSGDGVRNHPGFFNEFIKLPGTTCRVGFWVINSGCKYIISVSAVRPKGGGPCKAAVVSDSTDNAKWKHIVVEEKICATMDRLRVEVQIEQPGIFMIDGITIEDLKLEK